MSKRSFKFVSVPSSSTTKTLIGGAKVSQPKQYASPTSVAALTSQSGGNASLKVEDIITEANKSDFMKTLKSSDIKDIAGGASIDGLLDEVLNGGGKRKLKGDGEQFSSDSESDPQFSNTESESDSSDNSKYAQREKSDLSSLDSSEFEANDKFLDRVIARLQNGDTIDAKLDESDDDSDSDSDDSDNSSGTNKSENDKELDEGDSDETQNQPDSKDTTNMTKQEGKSSNSKIQTPVSIDEPREVKTSNKYKKAQMKASPSVDAEAARGKDNYEAFIEQLRGGSKKDGTNPPVLIGGNLPPTRRCRIVNAYPFILKDSPTNK